MSDLSKISPIIPTEIQPRTWEQVLNEYQPYSYKALLTLERECKAQIPPDILETSVHDTSFTSPFIQEPKEVKEALMAID